MTLEHRYAGPDGEGIGALPPGTGAAIGSEYCVHLLPGAPEMARACAAAAARGIPLVLLTPWFRDAELKGALPLFRAIPRESDTTVAVNDWGALLSLRVLFPWLGLTIGRLLSGQKRCPRIETSARLSPADKAWHRQGLFASAAARGYLARDFGVSGYHVDALPGTRAGGDEAPGDAGSGRRAEPAATGAGTPATLFLHAPYAIVTVSDACPWLGGRSASCAARCPRPCRDAAVLLREPSMGAELIQRGKARFVRAGAPPAEAGVSGSGIRTVLYDDLP